MIYRSAGRACAAYADERLLLPHAIDRMALALLLAVAAVVLPLVGPDYLSDAILLPFLALSLAAIGLNILTGYAGQLSLGTAAFMAVGAFMTYNAMLRIPHMPVLGAFIVGGVCAAAGGGGVGLPSLRIKGPYPGGGAPPGPFFLPWGG